jgi:hypothetical protein
MHEKYEIGQAVWVKSVCHAEYGVKVPTERCDTDTVPKECNERTIVKKAPPAKSGWYVGYTFIFLGEYNEGGQRTNCIGQPSGDFDSAFLFVRKSVKVARIRFHARGKEHKAMFEDIE